MTYKPLIFISDIVRLLCSSHIGCLSNVVTYLTLPQPLPLILLRLGTFCSPKFQYKCFSVYISTSNASFGEVFLPFSILSASANLSNCHNLVLL